MRTSARSLIISVHLLSLFFFSVIYIFAVLLVGFMKVKVLDEISLTAASVQRQQKHWTRTQHRLRDRCSDPDEASEHVGSDSRSLKGAEGTSHGCLDGVRLKL